MSYLGTEVNQWPNIGIDIRLLVNDQPSVPLGQDTVRLTDIVDVDIR